MDKLTLNNISDPKSRLKRKESVEVLVQVLVKLQEEVIKVKNQDQEEM